MAHNLASDSIHTSGKLPPTLTPTGHFAGKPALPISRSVTLIGSRKQARLQLISSTVSQNHALIVNADSGPFIRDLASREHVYVNGKKVKEASLNEGDEIQIGRFTFKFAQSPNAKPRKGEPAGHGSVDVDGSPIPIPMEGKSLLIGRRDTCDVPLLEDSVSTTHAIVFEMDGRRYLRDLASRTGTFVNGKQIHQVELRPGDEIRVGDTSMRYLTDTAPGVTQEEMTPAELGAVQTDLVDLGTEEAPVARRPVAPIEPEPEVELEPVAQEPAVEDQAAAIEQELGLEPIEPAMEVEPVAEVEQEIEIEPAEAVEIEPEAIEAAPAAGGFDIQDDSFELPADDDVVIDVASHAPVEEPPAPAAPVARRDEGKPWPKKESKWGANQDHFLGGMPLPLSKPAPAEPTAAPEPEPVAEAAEPEAVEVAPVDDEIFVEAEAPGTPAEDEIELAPVEPVAEQPAEEEEVALEPVAELAPEPVAEVAPVEEEPVAEAPQEVELRQPLDLRGIEEEAEETEEPAPAAPLAIEPEPVEVEEEPVEIAAEMPTPVAEEPVEEPVVEEEPVEVAARAPAPIEEEPAEVEAEAEEQYEEAEAEEEEEEAPASAIEVAESMPMEELPDDFFRLPDEPSFGTEAKPAARESATAVADLSFDAPEMEELTAGIDMAAMPEAPLEMPPIEAPSFDDASMDEIDFATGVAEEVAASGEFEPIDVSEITLPPLDLGDVNDVPVFSADAGIDSTIAPIFPGVEAEAPAAKPKRGRPKKKKEPEAPAPAPLQKKFVPPPFPIPAKKVEKPVEPKVEKKAPPPPPVEELVPLPEPPPAVDEAPPAAAKPIKPVELTPPVEVISETESTPESALELEEAVAAAPLTDLADVSPVELSDTGFSRAVEEFSADSTGPIVEQPAEAPAPVAEPEQPLEPPSLDDLGVELVPADEPIDVEEIVAEAQPETIEPLEEVAEAIEEVEQPTPLLGDAQDSLAVIDDTESADEAVERLFDLEPSAPAASVMEEEVELEPLEELPAAQDVEAVEAEPVEVAYEPVAQQPIAEEPVAEEPQEVDLEEYGLDTLTDPVAEPMADIDIAPRGQAPAEPVADDFGLDLEPMEAVEPVEMEPVAPPQPEPVAKAPHTPPPPQTPPQRDAAPPRRQVAEEFSWGANQDQFYGGMPLKLTPPPRPTPQPQAPAPVADVNKQPPRPKPAAPTRIGANISPDTFAGGGRQTIPPPRMDIPPLAKDAKQAAPVATGFDGLAMPPGARDADVFSGQSGSLSGGFGAGTSDDVFGRRTTAAPQHEPQAPAAAPRRPRPAAKAEATGDVWAAHPLAETEQPQRPRRAPAVAPPVEEPIKSEAPRKRRWFGLKTVFLVGILCMAAAAGGVYQFMPLKSVVTGSIKFNNFASLPRLKRVELANQQRDLLADKATREDARGKLIAMKRDAAGGFLDDLTSYSRVVSAATLDINSDKGVLTMPYVGAGTEEDRIRVLALMQALYGANKARVAQAESLNHTVTSLTQEQVETSKRIDERKKQIEELNGIAENRPDATERTKLEADAARLESAYNAAVANVARLSTELKQLQAGTPPAPPTPQAPPPDAQLSQLQGDLQKLNDRVGVVQEGRSEKAATARHQLDVALESFNKQIEQAQGVIKNNPQLLAFITDAQKTIEQTRELTDQLIRRQQEQYSQLSDLKVKLNEKMLARRAEVWKKDPELLKLMDQRDIKTRQHNAATAQNMTKEAGDLKAELDYLNAAIRARQTIVADDGFYADAIDQLQKIIDSTQKGMEDDRKHTMQVLDEMQASFAKNQPALANLTPEQKQLAAEMEKRLADVSAARRQYTESADAANKQADEEIRGLQVSAATLASKVAARKKQLADSGNAAPEAEVPAAPSPQDQAKLVETKSAELAAAEKGRTEAEGAFFAANKKLVEIKNRLDQARSAGERRDAIMRQLDIDDKYFKQLNNQLELKTKEAGISVYPSAPTAADVKLDPKPDQRPIYALGSVAAIAAVMALFIGLSFIGGRSERAVTTPPPPGFGPEDEGDNGEMQSQARGRRAAHAEV